jgi:hypothetical protein
MPLNLAGDFYPIYQAANHTFAEFTEVDQIETDFAAKVANELNKIIVAATA